MAGAAENGKECGDYGGVKRSTGEPCGQPAGWRTDHKGEGRCTYHEEDAVEEHQRVKADFLEILRTSPEATLYSACEQVGIDYHTMLQWRRGSDEFDQQVREAKLANYRAFLDKWEDNVRVRILSGQTAAALERFYITNIDKQISDLTGRPRIWRYRQHMEISGEVSGEVHHRHTMEVDLEDLDLSVEELRALKKVRAKIEAAAEEEGREIEGEVVGGEAA